MSTQKTCTWLCITVLLIIAQTGKQPRWPSVRDRINKQWYIQTMECYLALKKKKGYQAMKKTWKNCKYILISKRRQSEKATCCTIQQYDILEKEKLWRQ